MRKFFATVIDLQGRPVENATVRLTAYPGGGDEDLFSDDGGLVAIANPMTTDVNGFCECYLAAGRKTITVTTTSETRVINDYTHDA